MWEVAPLVDSNDIPVDRQRREKYSRKYAHALQELDERLARILRALNSGVGLREVLSLNWIHPEPAGVFAVCINDPALRLYFLPIPGKKLIVTLTIGDKRRQSEDIKMTTAWAREILHG